MHSSAAARRRLVRWLPAVVNAWIEVGALPFCRPMLLLVSGPCPMLTVESKSSCVSSTTADSEKQQQQQQQQLHRPIFILPPVDVSSLRQCASHHLDIASNIEKNGLNSSQLSSNHNDKEEQEMQRRTIAMDYIGTFDPEELDDLQDEVNGMMASGGDVGSIGNRGKNLNQVLVLPPPDVAHVDMKENSRPNASRSSINNQPPSRHGDEYKAAMPISRDKVQGKRWRKDHSRHARSIYNRSSTAREFDSAKPMEEFYVSKRIDADFQHDMMADTDNYEWDDTPRQNLRRALRTSHDIMRDIDYSIKDDMLLVHKTCRSIALKRSAHPKLRQKLHRLGAESIVASCDEVSFRLQSDALRHWFNIIKEEIRQQKVQQYKRYHSLSKLESCIERIYQKRMALACLHWIDETEQRRKAEHYSSAILIQSSWRVKVAVDMTEKLRAEKRQWAMSTLQRVCRGLSARLLLKNLILERDRLNATLVLQCFVRCQSAQMVLKQHKIDRKREYSAIMVQKSIRRYDGRRIALQLREERRQRLAALFIQRISRGRRGRLVFQKRKSFVKMTSAATAVQKYIRRHLDTKVASQLREERERKTRETERVTLILQRVYRGHRGRMTMKRIIYEQVLEARRRHGAATCIQGLLRELVAKRKVKLLKRKDKASMIGEARQWVEMWSEDIGAWYYYNGNTEESLWEPPLTGYTNADSQLVLQNGRVIMDPCLIHNQCDEDSRKCAECEIKHASHYCEQCEEVFCSTCVIKAHRKDGDCASHKYSRIAGPIECSHCKDDPETVPALRWCVECDVPFCLSCWDKLHPTEGEGSEQHSCYRIDKDGNIQATVHVWNADGYAGDAVYGDDGIDTGGKDNYVYDGSAGTATTAHDHIEVGGQWSIHQDQGVPYYYNESAGEST